MTDAARTGPLTGVRVLDLTRGMPGAVGVNALRRLRR